MDLIYAALLGIVEGLTEFLPISSTGHLIIAEKYIHFKDAAEMFTVIIQLGAILAVIWYYRKDIIAKIKGLFGGRKTDQNFWLNLVLATIPAGILGLLLSDSVDKWTTPGVVAVALIVGAVVLWFADNRDKTSAKNHEEPELNKVSTKQAVLAGLAQCLALVPGTSRSGASIVGGMFAGMNRSTATAFSFYMGIPVIGLASAYKFLKGYDHISAISGGASSLLIGLVVTFLVALIAVSWLLKYVSTHNFRIFVYYRLVLGVLILLIF